MTDKGEDELSQMLDLYHKFSIPSEERRRNLNKKFEDLQRKHISGEVVEEKNIIAYQKEMIAYLKEEIKSMQKQIVFETPEQRDIRNEYKKALEYGGGDEDELIRLEKEYKKYQNSFRREGDELILQTNRGVKKFDLNNVDGDGLCLFRSLVNAMNYANVNHSIPGNNETETSKNLRRDIRNNLTKVLETPSDDIFIGTEEEIKREIQNLNSSSYGNSDNWPTQVSVAMFKLMYPNIGVNVFIDNANYQYFSSGDQTKPRQIYIYNEGLTHFQWCSPADTKQSAKKSKKSRRMFARLKATRQRQNTAEAAAPPPNPPNPPPKGQPGNQPPPSPKDKFCKLHFYDKLGGDQLSQVDADVNTPLETIIFLEFGRAFGDNYRIFDIYRNRRNTELNKDFTLQEMGFGNTLDLDILIVEEKKSRKSTGRSKEMYKQQTEQRRTNRLSRLRSINEKQQRPRTQTPKATRPTTPPLSPKDYSEGRLEKTEKLLVEKRKEYELLNSKLSSSHDLARKKEREREIISRRLRKEYNFSSSYVQDNEWQRIDKQVFEQYDKGRRIAADRDKIFKEIEELESKVQILKQKETKKHKSIGRAKELQKKKTQQRLSNRLLRYKKVKRGLEKPRVKFLLSKKNDKYKKILEEIEKLNKDLKKRKDGLNKLKAEEYEEQENLWFIIQEKRKIENKYDDQADPLYNYNYWDKSAWKNLELARKKSLQKIDKIKTKVLKAESEIDELEQMIKDLEQQKYEMETLETVVRRKKVPPGVDKRISDFLNEKENTLSPNLRF